MPLPAILGGIAKVGAVIGKGAMATGKGLAAGAKAGAKIGSSAAKSGAKIGSRGARSSNKLKITTKKIKSNLIKSNKKLKKLKNVEDRLLEREKDRLRKSTKESVLGKGRKKIANKLINNPVMSLFGKIIEFFSLIVAAIIVKALPTVLKAIQSFFDKIGNFIKTVKDVLGKTGEAIGNFFDIFNSSPEVNMTKLDDDKKKIEEGLKEIQDNGLSKLQEQTDDIKQDAKSGESSLEDQKKKRDKTWEKSNKLDDTGQPQGKELSTDTSLVVQKEFNPEVENLQIQQPPSYRNLNFRERYSGGTSNNTSNKVATSGLSMFVEKRQNLAEGGVAGGLVNASQDVANSVHSFKLFEQNSLNTESNLSDLENNVSLFKEFGDNLIALSSNMSTSSDSGSSSSSFSIADSTSNLPIVGRVGSTGGSTGPHVHIQRFPQPTNWEQDHITKDHPVIQNILVGGKPLNEWEFTSASQPDRWGRPHYGPDFGGSGINNQPIQLTGGITYDPSSLYQESSGAEGNNILFNYGGEQFVIFHLNSGPEVKQVAGQGPLKSMSPVPLKRSGIDTEIGENVVFVYGVQHINTIVKV